MNKTLLAAAVVGLLSSQSFASGNMNSSKSDSSAMVKCEGVNACKGHADCGGKDNVCKGHNACKGKGFKMLSKKDCTEAKAELKKKKNS